MAEPLRHPEEIVADKANRFAFRLSRALAEDSGDENMVCSPYSVWLPLAALLNATNSWAKPRLLAALSAAGISEDEINVGVKRILYDLTRQREKEYHEETGYPCHETLRIANLILAGKDVTLKKEFAHILSECFKGRAMHVDFSSREAVERINHWVSETTGGHISDIVSGFAPMTVAAFASAMYFSDRWKWELKVDRKKVFYSPSGEEETVFIKRMGDGQIYYEDEKSQTILLEFLTGGGLYIILPKEKKATEFLQTMTNEDFIEIRRKSAKTTGTLIMPRFNIESKEIDLTATLTAMGMPLFDEDAALLTCGLVEEDIPIWLSTARHKAVIKVDEMGTTAAAVTFFACPGGIPKKPEPTEPFIMNCNKPFVFVLYGDITCGERQVLFTGIVNHP